MAKGLLTKITDNIPIRWGKFINKDMEEEKVIFIGHEKAIYGADGEKLDQKIKKIKSGISDAFSQERDYAAGDYCIYQNALYKFTNEKPAGPWAPDAALPTSLSSEIQSTRGEVEGVWDFVNEGRTGIKPLIDGVTINDISRFWHNGFIGYLEVLFTNQSKIQIWTPFIEFPGEASVESMTFLTQSNMVVYAMGISGSRNKISSATEIPAGTHGFTLVLPLMR